MEFLLENGKIFVSATDGDTVEAGAQTPPFLSFSANSPGMIIYMCRRFFGVLQSMP